MLLHTCGQEALCFLAVLLSIHLRDSLHVHMKRILTVTPEWSEVNFNLTHVLDLIYNTPIRFCVIAPPRIYIVTCEAELGHI